MNRKQLIWAGFFTVHEPELPKFATVIVSDFFIFPFHEQLKTAI
jgi:hypothetical protein